MSAHNIASGQAEAIRQKADHWRRYISELAKELPFHTTHLGHRTASLWASTFTYIEWLVVFEQCASFPNVAVVAESLNRHWGWEVELAKIFVTSGRHPIAHVGQANAFHSYREYHGIPTSVSLDVNQWSEAVTSDWNRHHPYMAISIWPPDNMDGEGAQSITFYHQMLRDNLLSILAEGVANKISTETDEEILQKTLALNKQIPH